MEAICPKIDYWPIFSQWTKPKLLNYGYIIKKIIKPTSIATFSLRATANYKFQMLKLWKSTFWWHRDVLLIFLNYFYDYWQLEKNSFSCLIGNFDYYRYSFDASNLESNDHPLRRPVNKFIEDGYNEILSNSKLSFLTFV